MQIPQSILDFLYLPWVRAIIIIAVFFLIAKIFVIIAEKIVLKFTKKTKTNLDDMLVEKTNFPISALLFLFGTRLALITLNITNSIGVYTKDFVDSLIILSAAYLIAVILDVLIDGWLKNFTSKTKSKVDDAIIPIFHRTSKIVVFIVAILFVLQSWGVQIGPLLASLGIAGIAVAFALQNTLGNIFGGVSMIFDKTVKVGDTVELESGESGTVHDVGIRSTKIKTWNNYIITVPNGKLANSKIINKTLPDPSVRIDILFGVRYGSDPDKVKKEVMKIIVKEKEVSKEPAPKVWFMEMADFSLNFKLMFYVDDLSKKWEVHQSVITKVYKMLDKKFGIPFPTHTVYIKKRR